MEHQYDVVIDRGAIALVPVPEHRAWIDSKTRPMLDTWPRLARALGAANRAQESVAEYLARVDLPLDEPAATRLSQLDERALVRAAYTSLAQATRTDVPRVA